eukprot:m.70572 g.70572  ORF g.70572 m.70572 type:complete len:115 (+) comp7886_c0_seq2:1079-1423(+)
MIATIQCEPINEQYNRALDAICFDALDGLFKLCISHSATGLFFVILVATLSHLASIYGAQRGYYVNVNSAGEFAPATSGSAWSGPGRAAPSWSNPNARQAPQTEWYDEKSPLLS